MPSAKSVRVILAAAVAAMLGIGGLVRAQSLSASYGPDVSARPVAGGEQTPGRWTPEFRPGEGRPEPEGHKAAIPLKPPSRSDRTSPVTPATPAGGFRTVVTVGGSLAIVLGLFFVFAWLVRRGVPGAIPVLPREAVEVLGRTTLAARQQVHLIRLGNKLILVSVAATGAETLSEVTDAEEVQRLLVLCRQREPASATSMFRQALERFGREPAQPDPWREGSGNVRVGVGRRPEGREDRDDA